MATKRKNVPKTTRGMWLIGGKLENICGSKLPSNKQVLGRFFHLHSEEKMTIQASAKATARELVPFWAKARIPIRQECHVINKIKALHATWHGLKKSSSRQTMTQQTQEQLFVDTLDDSPPTFL